MGNGVGKLALCFTDGGGAGPRRRQACAAVTSEPYDESLGHSFCYVRSNVAVNVQDCAAAAAAAEEAGPTTFRAISGAAVSANASTPLSTALLYNELTWPAAAAFESSDSFSAVPLQPIPRFPSGPLSGPIADRGFLSGPIERGFMSGPLDRQAALFSGPLDRQAALFSGPLDRPAPRLPRSLSLRRGPRRAARLLHGVARAISRTIKGPSKSADQDISTGWSSSLNTSAKPEADDSDTRDPAGGGVQWAQGKAGEDRVHVVVSEERGWVFVGIYDGFNGPDATDYLLSNLYSAVQRELKGLLWEDELDSSRDPSDDSVPSDASISTATCATKKKGRFRNAVKHWEENRRRWKYEWDQERSELDQRLKKQMNRMNSNGSTVNHEEVLKALSKALRKTEEAYLDIADKMVVENPELALMGSCVLVMLMKGEDVYLMNVGDSRAVLAHKAELDVSSLIQTINEEASETLESSYCGVHVDGLPNLDALQLTWDHNTFANEEVQRIRNEHPDDDSAIVNDRVKGSLKVTRAFGAGFLKQPKWNNALLEMFRIDYVGTSPYITCSPSVYHHKVGSKDRFLILSSDGLYQYFTNEEAVAQVELFVATSPDGDPAQHLVEEVLFRAADKAGIDFHELLEIPQGDRRRYHDDVSIIIISLEGRIWRSCV